MRGSRGAPAGTRRRDCIRDHRGSMQVVEVMIVGLLVVGAVVAVSTMNAPVTETEGFKQDNERLVKDSLQAMLTRSASQEHFGSILEEYVMEAIAGNPRPLMEYMNRTLPHGAMYNVYLDNHYGEPFPVITQGTPPREAVAGSTQFVPKLAYTFMTPEFERYHKDFHMNMFGLPIQNGILLHDEGEPVEVAVTYQDVAPNGQLLGDPVTLVTYTHTALRDNQPGSRSWPSVSIWYDDPDPALGRGYVFDASDAELYGDRITGGTPLSGDAYNLTWTMQVEETADVRVPRNAEMTMEFTRGFDFNATRQQYLENLNADWWKDWTFTGNVMKGWTVTAKVKEPFRNQAVPLHLSSNFRTPFDTAYPHYNPVTYSMGSGVQGLTHLLIKSPGLPSSGAFGREVYTSNPKPIISGTGSHWGISIGNDGEKLLVHEITVRDPHGRSLIANVANGGGTLDGTWTKTGPGQFRFEPAADTYILRGDQAYVAFDVTAGSTRDNSYRNQDYLEVLSRFNPENGTGVANLMDPYEYDSRSWRMGSEWIYRDRTHPADICVGSCGDAVGWPTQEGREYWVTGGTYGYQIQHPGRATYSPLPAAATANAFGNYQGYHVDSRTSIVDWKGDRAREFDVGESVHIQNDFSALFGQLSQLHAAGDITVSDLKIRTDIYTPELAWKGIPSESFDQVAAIATDFIDVAFLLADDLTQNGREDVIAVGSGGLIYALDARTGGKLWMIDTNKKPTQAALMDANDDGISELVVGFEGGQLRGYTTSTANLPNRLLWTHDLTPAKKFGIGLWKIPHILVPEWANKTHADLIVALNTELGQASLHGIDVEGVSWATTETVHYNASATFPTNATTIRDLVPLSWSKDGTPQPHIAIASANKTVTMLSMPDLRPVWLEKIPYQVNDLEVLDLDGNGNHDLIANTRTDLVGGSGGDRILTLTGESGEFGPTVRVPEISLSFPTDAVFTGTKAIATGASSSLLADTSGLYGNIVQPMLTLQPEFQEGIGVHKVPDGTVYAVSSNGFVMFDWMPNPVGDGFHWNASIPAQSFSEEIRDLHVAPDYGTGGLLYLIDMKGLIRSTSDEPGSSGPVAWTEIAHLCSHATLPDAGLTCDDSLWVRQVHVVEDANGNALEMWLLSYQDTISRLHSFDLATNTWTLEKEWPNVHMGGFDLNEDGSLWLSGYDFVAETGLIKERLPDGSWRDHTLMRKSPMLTSIQVQEDGTGWASSHTGEVLHRTEDTLWMPYFVDGGANYVETLLVEADDGTVWMIGDGFRTVPLESYEREGTAVFSFQLKNLSGYSPGAGETFKLILVALEGHLGGDSGATPVEEAVTGVRWEVRGPGKDWQELTPNGGPPVDPDIYQRYYETEYTCKGCGRIEVRATLSNDWRTGGEGGRSMGGATPVVKVVGILVYDEDHPNDPLVEETVIVEPDSLHQDSTVEHSTFYGGAVLAKDRRPWSFLGISDHDTASTKRHIAVSESGAVDPAPEVFVVGPGPGGMERWVLDAETGYPKRPSDLVSFGFGPDDRVDQVLSIPIVGDAKDDLVLAGKLGGEGGALWGWDPSTETDYALSDADGSSTVHALIDTGFAKNVRTVTYGGSAEQVTHVTGEQAGQQLDIVWTTAPSDDQGKATFQYFIPKNAMYGTGIVVSELRFDVVEGGTSVTQTARLVEWFNMSPPGRDVPRPPIYTVQIVSWFNES